MDALWGKEPSTVGGNLGLLRRIRIDALEGKFFRNPASVPPFPLEDLVGMRPAVMVLHRSLQPGRYKDYLQWDSTRIYSGAYGNIWSDEFLLLESATLASTDRNMVVTTTPT